MNILLDTHIALWAIIDDPSLSKKARELILNQENTLYISTVSFWEIRIKTLLHPDKFPLNYDVFCGLCIKAGYKIANISLAAVDYHARLNRAGSAPRHQDPFDRMLICQAAVGRMKFLTHDHLLTDYHEECIELV